MSGVRIRKINLLGFMLIELIIALGINIIILSAIFGIYLSLHRNIKNQIALEEIQGNANQVIQILTSAIKSAGQTGCARFLTEEITMENKLNGTESSLKVKSASQPKASLVSTPKNNELMIETETHFRVGDKIIISDCRHAEAFKIQKMQGNSKMISEKPIRYSYSRGSEIFFAQSNEFFINQNESTFCVRDINHRKKSLVDKIKNLSFHYTIKQDDYWEEVSANQIQSWSTVVGVWIDFDAFSGNTKKHWRTYVALSS